MRMASFKGNYLAIIKCFGKKSKRLGGNDLIESSKEKNYRNFMCIQQFYHCRDIENQQPEAGPAFVDLEAFGRAVHLERSKPQHSGVHKFIAVQRIYHPEKGLRFYHGAFKETSQPTRIRSNVVPETGFNAVGCYQVKTMDLGRKTF